MKAERVYCDFGGIILEQDLGSVVYADVSQQERVEREEKEEEKSERKQAG